MLASVRKFFRKLLPESVRYRTFLTFTIFSFVIITAAFVKNFTFALKKVGEKQLYIISNQIYLNLIDFNTIINEGIITANSLTKEFENVKFIPENNRRQFLSLRVEKILNSSENLLGIWIVMKPYTLDKLDYKYQNKFTGDRGNFWVSYYKQNFKILKDTFSVKYYELLSKYANLFENSKSEIYIDAPLKVTYPTSRELYKISIIAPIKKGTKIIGIVGVDIPLSKIDKIFKTNIPNTMNIIINKNDIIIYHTNRDYIAHNIQNIYLNLKKYQFISFYYKIIESIKLNKFVKQDFKKTTYYTNYTLFKLPKSKENWLIITNVPVKTIYREGFKQLVSFFIPFTLILLIILIVSLIVSKYINNNFEVINKKIEEFAQGIYKKIELESKVWVTKDIKDFSKKLNDIVEYHKQLINFTKALSKGDYEYNFKPVSEEDELGKTLLELKETLLKNKKEEEKREQEQKLKTWYNTAITKINDILRLYPEKEKFAPEVLKYIVNYIDAIQGGFFVLVEQDDKKFLELIAFYSYNREVYHRKKVEIGEGLVGNVALEKKSIYTNVPDDYIEITSGMGKAKPNYLFIVPFVQEEEIYGILEITSLKPIDKYKRDLVEEISTIIAAELASAKITEQTQKLLQETQKTAEQLKVKEKQLEEITKQLEKLQLENYEHQERFRSFINALNEFAFVVEFDKYLNVIFINKKLLDVLGITYSDALASDYYLLFQIRDIPKHQNYINRVLKGEKITYNFEIQLIRQESIWVKAVLVPQYTKAGKIEKFLFIGIDYTEIYKKEKEIEQLQVKISELEEQINIQSLEFDSIVAEYDLVSGQLQEKEDLIKELEQEKQKLQNSLEFFKKELEKRIKRSKKIEQNLKEKNKALQQEVEKLKEELKKYKK